VRILTTSGTIRQNVIFRLWCVGVFVCRWSCLKLITVGFGGYRVDIKINRLVKGELKCDLHLFISG